MPLKVIYISGEGRSGSTLLDRILGTLENVSSFNEIYELWEHGHIEDGKCSCGQKIKECSFWKQVSTDVINKHGDPRKILKLQNDVDHSRHFLKILTGVHSATFRKKLDAYKEILDTLYRSLAKHSGNDIIVDSSKLPSRALILSQIPDIQVYVIHLVRDVRGVIYSWSKYKWDPSLREYLPRYRPFRTIMAWIARNLLTEVLASKMFYLRLNYEDWAKQPRDTLQKTVDLLEPTAGKTLPFKNANEINLGPIHSVRGNPDRFLCGVVEVLPDDTWTYKLDRNAARIARLLAFPLLVRYRYLHFPFSVGRKNET